MLAGQMRKLGEALIDRASKLSENSKKNAESQEIARALLRAAHAAQHNPNLEERQAIVKDLDAVIRRYERREDETTGEAVDNPEDAEIEQLIRARESKQRELRRHTEDLARLDERIRDAQTGGSVERTAALASEALKTFLNNCNVACETE